MTIMRFGTFALFAYLFHMILTFWGSGSRSGLQISYHVHVPGHIIFILFSYSRISSFSLISRRTLFAILGDDEKRSSKLDDEFIWSAVFSEDNDKVAWLAWGAIFTHKSWLLMLASA